MRYLSPIPNPLAHYWEEELTGFWGIWLRLRERSGRFFAHILGEVIFANVYLLYQLVFGRPKVSVFTSSIARTAARADIGAISKRAVDIIGAAAGLIISLPLWIVVPLAIKLDSEGPVLYLQLRVGRNRRRAERRSMIIDGHDRRGSADRRRGNSYGRPFRIMKFRTMHDDAEKESGPVWATHDDPRITRVGRILRKTRLDETPQLINVLKGEMSLVGPRPERPYFVRRLDEKIDHYRSRFDVRPGITGLAQVEYKYDENLDDVNNKTSYDLTYIKNWRLTEDIRILLKTVIVVMTARGM
jgi:lipopolysaccharide/colanic/teichoic acid biosynthesis glycosyltransferase